ncbi:cytochrome P450 [Streptosporangium sp. NPDC003464]
MSVHDGGDTLVRRAAAIPFHRVLRRLARGPLNALAEIGGEARGEVVRLGLGPFRPYLVTHPDHVQQVMRGGWSEFAREGMFWRPLRRVLGTTVIGEGPAWESSRKILQPLFTARYVASLAEGLAGAVTESVDELDEAAGSGHPIDAAEEMAAIVNRAVVRALFGDKISRADGELLAPALDAAATSMGLRLLMPSIPYSVRVPGDRAVTAATALVDGVVYPLISKARAGHDGGPDIVSALCRARAADQDGDRRIRDDLVGVYVGATETTAMALTWLWPVLKDHPEVYARLVDEIDRVVGPGPVRPSHVPELRYTKSVLQELLRLYPVAWLWSRTAVGPAELGGVRIEAGAQLLISPYATHRLDEFWDRPADFDPERFAPGAATRRHRYAYFPFGGGPHQCLGRHLFYLEAPLIIAAVLRRFRPVVRGAGPFTPFPAVTLRPRQKVELDLLPRTPRARDPLI